MSDEIRSYAELRELIRVSLWIQHPEWVNSDGNSPVCDFYDARLAELLGLLPPREDEAELPMGDSAERLLLASNSNRFIARAVNEVMRTEAMVAPIKRGCPPGVLTRENRRP